MNILVVDDTKSVHAFIDSLFAGSGHHLNHVFDGEEALKVVNSGSMNFDLILMDWEMPGKNGVDTLREIRNLGFDVPIIMVTSRNSVDDIQNAISFGASEFVMKPFTREILFNKITDVVGQEVA